MPRSTPTLLTRLRRHRGLWVLAVAVLLIKLVSGTICLGDRPAARIAAVSAVPTVAVAMAPADASVDAADACLLGEAGGCHCACAHSAALPAALVLPVAHMDVSFASPEIHSGFTPAATGSLLRPPIA
ncbi:hypothetical protein ASG87_06100 [Frateuria sp. Soil773]|uniref:hypothetical protein n=1 Tax=Frateuria sp. Soil773 TaxID=1736407 RepID=UPI0006FF6B76|nr:hypothetical protein [Frateuria sp. Soil773]KRE89108.1 hypothetical protein ASG87_06100 [Frateuria sp. Soil773]